MKDYESLNWALERVVGPELRYLMAEFINEYPEDAALINSFEGWLVDKEIEVFNYKKSLNHDE